MLIVIILVSFMNLILTSTLVFVLYKYFSLKKAITNLQETALTTKENNIIKEILDSSNSKGIFNIERSSLNIIYALQNYYKLDYCTILKLNKQENQLECISSNAHKSNIKDIEEYCNKLYRETDGNPKINYDKKNLNYISASERHIKYSYFIPLCSNSEVIGALYIENRDDYRENHFELEFFNIVISNISVAFENSLLHDEKQNMAFLDPLTKVFNRNYMEKYHLKSYIDNKNTFSFAILDIDNFKIFNDTYGHDFGDVVLKKLSNFIKQKLNKNEEIYRWGGEEFVISFLNKNKKETYDRVEAIRSAISKYNIENDNTIVNITVSFGISEFYEDANNMKDLFLAADKALYKSKESGRNKTTIY